MVRPGIGARRKASAGAVRTVLVVGALLTSVASCTGGPPAKPSVKPRLTLTDWRNGDDAMLAARHGVLVLGRDGCVGLRSEDGQRQVVLRWPAGTRLSADGKAVVGGQYGERFVFGKLIGLGGGSGGGKVPPYCAPSLWEGTFDVQQPL